MPSPIVDALLPGQQNPAQPPRGFWGGVGNFAYDALGLGDVAKALRGQMTDVEAQDFAFGAAAGLIPIGRGLKAAKGIKAYHGSPHDFDRFDMSKIGTGEGAQAYGHGLYFAENEATAKAYREALAGQAANPGRNVEMTQIAREMEKYAVPGAYRKYNDPRGYELAKRYDELMDARAADKGKMYEVNINAHPDQFLDWDKPLAGQSEIAGKLPPTFLDAAKQEAYHRALASSSKPRADQLWSMVKNPLEAPGGFAVEAAKKSPQVSQELSSLGIPGIKYLDQGSRTAGEGSRNYVVFDDKLIDIVKKYGLAALGLPPAMTAGAQIWNQDAASPAF